SLRSHSWSRTISTATVNDPAPSCAALKYESRRREPASPITRPTTACATSRHNPRLVLPAPFGPVTTVKPGSRSSRTRPPNARKSSASTARNSTRITPKLQTNCGPQATRQHNHQSTRDPLKHVPSQLCVNPPSRNDAARLTTISEQADRPAMAAVDP